MNTDDLLAVMRALAMPFLIVLIMLGLLVCWFQAALPA